MGTRNVGIFLGHFLPHHFACINDRNYIKMTHDNDNGIHDDFINNFLLNPSYLAENE